MPWRLPDQMGQFCLPWLEWPGWLRMRTAINKLHTIRPMIEAIQNQHQAMHTLHLLLLLVLTMLTMEPTLEDTEHSDGILTILSYLLDTRTCSSRNSTVIFTGLNIFTLHSK